MIWMWSLAMGAVPTGWNFYPVKHYEVEQDGTVAKDGTHSAKLTGAKQAKQFAALNQGVSPVPYRGKRVRYTAWMRSEGVVDWAGSWMRVDAGKKSTAFDNMQKRALKGDQDWKQVSIVLDVHPKATTLVYGMLLSGPGTVWLDDVKLEIVDDSVPVTDMKVVENARKQTPANLDFEL